MSNKFEKNITSKNDYPLSSLDTFQGEIQAELKNAK